MEIKENRAKIPFGISVIIAFYLIIFLLFILLGIFLLSTEDYYLVGLVSFVASAISLHRVYNLYKGKKIERIENILFSTMIIIGSIIALFLGNLFAIVPLIIFSAIAVYLGFNEKAKEYFKK